mgnify:CR=1 FL=1
MNVQACIPLSNSVNPGEALLVGGVVEVHAVINAGVGGGQGDAGSGGIDLPDEYHRTGVGLELLDDAAAFLFLDLAINRHRSFGRLPFVRRCFENLFAQSSWISGRNRAKITSFFPPSTT